jgi:hypothetical protein
MLRIPILDMGNVLVSVDMDSFFKELVNIGLFQTTDQALRFCIQIENLQNLGIINFYNAIASHSTFSCNCGNFPAGRYKEALQTEDKIFSKARDLWLSSVVWKPNTEILNWLLDKLNDQTFDGIVIASNMGIDHYNITMKHALFKHPKTIKCISFQMGAIKPQYLFWKIVMEKVSNYVTKQKIVNLYSNESTHCTINDCVFLYVDDRIDYIEGAIEYNKQDSKSYILKTLQFNCTTENNSKMTGWLENG